MFLIRPWLYVGKLSETQDTALLRRYGIGAMLQLAESVSQSGIASLYLPVVDGEPLPFETLRHGVEFVQQQKAMGRKVLIACGAGISRSGAFAVAALKEAEELSLLEAFRQLHARHAGAMPLPALWQSLCDYYGEDAPYTQAMDVLGS